MRVDKSLVAAGHATSRAAAARLIESGRVLMDGSPVRKPSAPVPDGATLTVEPSTEREYVSRAGHKLAGALGVFPDVVTEGAVCLDAGASTGGFTQVLLEGGAARVAAVDVGHGQLDPRIREDLRVTAYEGLNVRHLVPEDIGGPVDLVVGDLSFISLTLVIGPLTAVTRPGGELVLMVKPQFEVGRSRLGKGGVVTNEADRRSAIETVVNAAAREGLDLAGQADSPLPGRDGNREHFLHLRKPGVGAPTSPGEAPA